MAAKGDDFSDFPTTPPPSAGSSAPTGESFDDFGTAPPDGSAPASLSVRTKKPDGDTTDYGAMPWTEVAKRGVMSTPAAVESGAKTAYKLITNPLQTAHGLYDLGHGVVSHVNRWAYDLPSDEQSAAIEAPIDAAAKENWENWSSVPGIKKHLATNLPGAALDVSTLAGGLGGVAGTAAKVADPLGAVSKLAETAGTVAERTNPLTGFGVLSGATKAKVPDLIDPKTGAAHPTVDAAIKGATDGQHDFQSLFGNASPETKQAFLSTLQAKGANANAAKEGILKSSDMTPVRTVVTGDEATAPAAREFASHAIQDNEAKAGSALSQMVGAPDNTDIHGIAKALDQARIKSLNAAVAPLERAKQDTGWLSRTAGGPSIMQSVQQGLKPVGVSVDNINTLHSYPNSRMAIQEIQTLMPGVQKGVAATAQQPALSAQSLVNLRSSLSKLQRTATGSDSAATGAILDAFDNHIADAVQKGKWIGGNSNQFLSDMQQGRAAYAKHMGTFHDRGGNNGTIASVTKPMADEEVGTGVNHAPGLGDDTYQSIQQKLSNALSSDSNSADTLTRLQKALGSDPSAQDALKQYMRRKVIFDPKSGGVANPDAIKAALTRHGNIANRLFTPEEQARIAHINTARTINGARTKNYAKPDTLGKTLRKAGTEAALKIGMARVAGSLVPGGEIMGSIAGWAGGEGLNRVGNHLENLKALRHEKRGAVPQQTLGSRVKSAGRLSARALTNPVSAQLGANANFSNSLIPARATGGSVTSTHDRLVGRLMALAESAKREEKKATKSILGLPDDTVTTALAKANEAVQK